MRPTIATSCFQPISLSNATTKGRTHVRLGVGITKLSVSTVRLYGNAQLATLDHTQG
jgi:hypothetical protein